jgi:anti-sigma regulatory factor (Ser/Thr protein kinase)
MRLHLRLSASPQDLRVVRIGLRSLLRRFGADEDVISDVLVACGEACGNAIRHPVNPSRAGFEIKAKADRERVLLIVRDFGHWREDEDLGGLGFTLMCALMDEVRTRQTAHGTFVRMVAR